MNDSMTVILASRNAGKIRELGELLAEYGMHVLGLDAFPGIGDIEETGVTFEENALIKARTVTQLTGHICIADDSGLEVDALNGAPGVYSARYSDDWHSLDGESRDQRNTRKLLLTLSKLPDAPRSCRFVCCMAAVKPDFLGGGELMVRGAWEGLVLDAPRGENGFGYDPVFFDPELGKSAAELSGPEKNARSHRGKALRLLMERWQEFVGQAAPARP